MKRRGFLKGLLSVPIVAKVVGDAPKEEPKPEPVKPPEPQPRVSVRLPRQNHGASSMCVSVAPGWDYPYDYPPIPYRK